MYLRCQVLLCVFAALLSFCIQSTETAKADSKCVQLLRSLLKNPTKNTIIAINTRQSKARYRCRKGFKLVGKKFRTCKRGQWMDRKEPKCLDSVPCGKPGNISHAKFNGSSFNYRDKLEYSCENGYKLSGPKRRTCREGGKWSRGPTCSAIRCSDATNITILNGDVFTSDPEYLFGATLAFECNEGYELEGPGTKTCLEFGWSPRTQAWPHCKERVCPDPGRPLNGYRFGNLKLKGSTLRFICKFGFELHGSRERTCTESMEWTGSLTTCQDGSTDCPVLGTPISGRKDGSKYNNGDIVKFECNNGFVLKGSAVRKCMHNGAWNGTEAICRNHELEDRFEDVNTTAFNLRKNVIDTLLQYTCNHENQTGCNKANVQATDTRGRAIMLNDNIELDLVFVIDASSSIKIKRFQKGLRFVKKLVEIIGASKRADETRIALITFGTEARLEFNLGDAKANTTDKAIEAIGKVRYTGGATASTLALEKVRNVVVPFARSNGQRVMMFITDGMSNIGGKPKKIAQYLRDKEQFEIYAIGIGKRTNERNRELMNIASSVKGDTHVIWVNSYSTLEKAIEKAANTKIGVGEPTDERDGGEYSHCGESLADFRARIVGGQNSERGWWPWQVGMYRLKYLTRPPTFTCGGALIAPRWILTAAHCFKSDLSAGKPNEVHSTAIQKLFIKAGDHTLTKQEESEQRINPAGIFLHPAYNIAKYKNDIALVKLEEPVELSQFVRTVCLPEKAEGDLASPKERGYATGWGATKAIKPTERYTGVNLTSEVLQYSSFTIQEDQLCSNKTTYYFNSTVTFCAGDGKGEKDTCKGDSGGAFVRDGKRGDDYRWIAVGIVSWGEGCAQKDKYGYYTRVYPFIDWIKKTMDEN